MDNSTPVIGACAPQEQPPWAYDSHNNELDPKLRAAHKLALREYIAASQNRSSNNDRVTRTCDANSLCRYWSGDDMNEAERTEPIILQNLLSGEQIDSILASVSVPGVWPRGTTTTSTTTLPDPLLLPPLCHRHRLSAYIGTNINNETEESPPPLSLPSSSPSVGLCVCDELRDLAHHMAWTDEHIVLYMHMNDWFRNTHPVVWSLIRNRMDNCCPLADKWIGESGSSRTNANGEEQTSDMLNVRCIELHHYAARGGLVTPGHRDNGSAITMSIFLSDPATVSGGDFITYIEGIPIAHKMERGDAIIFQSEKLHNVSTVISGLRQSLVVELWTSPSNSKDRFE